MGADVMSNRLPLKDRLKDHPLMAEPEEDEYCESPGRSGCGCCPSCEEWADQELERKRDEEWGEAILKDCEERGKK
jgi:hypothetical protein